MRKFSALLIAIVLLVPLAFTQSRETGAIRGTTSDDQGNPLPGVSITLSGANLMGQRTFVSDAAGEYRFPALPPGVYQVKAELQGFGTVIRENIRLSTTTTLAIDIQMKPASISEEVSVTAKAPTIDVKSTETASVTLANEVLRNIPYNQFSADIVNLAPGVSDNVAYGASMNTGIAYTMDGVNVADPAAGSSWVFSDPNIVEEAKVMGVGLPAEYGNFTGVIFNLVTKSGGNKVSGHFEFDFQGNSKGFWFTNNNKDYLADFPAFSSPFSKIMDINGHLGGPIIKDKLWYYVGLQYYRSKDRPAGFPEDVDYKQPRAFVKLSSQLTPTLNMIGSLQIDTYNGVNRDGGPTVEPNATVKQKSPEAVGNFSLTKVLSSKTFFDLKAAFFSGKFDLDPTTGLSEYMHFDYADNMQTDSSGYFYHAKRTRLQANASLTHYVDNFITGSHDFKFGAEFERSSVRDKYGYTGEGGALGDHVKYFDYYGYPYMAYQYDGSDTDTRYTRLEVFAQDSWQINKRLSISAGLRFSQNWGQVKGVSGNVFKTDRLSPRIGFTFDLLGDKTTVLKGHYGQFTEAMLTSYFDRMNPASAYSDYIQYSYNYETSTWGEDYRISPESLYSMDPNIKHPYMTQWTLGLERELFKDTSLGITYINRRWHNVVGLVDTNAEYNAITQSVDGYGDYTIYERTAETVGSPHYVITNLDTAYANGYEWILTNPYRKYQGLEMVFNKRFSNRWQLLASYTLGKATGSTDNGFGYDLGYGGNVYDPNFWINADGHSTSDPTHMIKIQGSYVIPKVDLSVNVYFRGITGNSWTARYRTEALTQGRVTFFLEPRGSNHYPMEKVLDLRLEKIFTIHGKYNLGILLDVFNVFNSNTVTSWGTRWGYDWGANEYLSTSNHELYGIMNPRQARLGIRLIF